MRPLYSKHFFNRQISPIFSTGSRRKSICVHLWMTTVLGLVLTGCKPDKAKVYPPDQLTVEHTISSEALLIGDQVKLHITAYYPTNGILEIPELGREKEVMQLNRDWNTILREDGLNQTDATFTLTSFKLGDHRLTSSNMICRVGDTTMLTNAFPVVMLKVRSSLTNESSKELADIKPMAKLPTRIPRWIWVVIGAALIAFLVGALVARMAKAKPKIKIGPPPPPPHVIALKALEVLQAKQLLEKGKCDPFYTELSQILRTYLEGRFNLNAPDETTEEIIEELSKSPELTGSQRNILQEFMRQADIVKFAKGHPDRNTMEVAFATTKQFVEETKKNPAPMAEQTEPRN